MAFVEREADMTTINFERRGESLNSRSRRESFELDLSVEWENIVFRFWERRGFGRSYYQGTIQPNSFAELAKAMMSADPNAAVKAFGAALAAGIPDAS
jgi:hypothetical protein